MPEQATALLREMFIIFAVTKLSGEVFERIKLPAVLGEILAGILLGPYAFAIIAPSNTIYSLAQLGAVFLLFTVGLQTRPKDIIHVGQKALQVAVAGMVLPFVLGFAYLMYRREPPHQAAFVAAAMVATSVGITARVLRDMHLLQTRAAKLILGAAVFDDVLGMVLLAVVVGLVSSSGVHWMQLSVLALEALGFVLLMLFLGPRLVGRAGPGMQRMSTRNPQMIVALAICMGLSAIAEQIGLTAIIGAFFAGLAFSDNAQQWNLRPQANAINEFLSPYFFFAMGAQLNIHVFNRELWLVASVITALAVIAKIVGCGLPLLREGRRVVLQVGVGMVPRGEVGLIIALIGLQMKLISASAYAVVMLMTAITTLLAPPLIRIAFRDAPKTATAFFEAPETV